MFNPIEATKNINYYICGYYYNDTLKSLIHRYKFGGEYALSELFSSMLYDRIKDIKELQNSLAVIEKIKFEKAIYLVTPLNACGFLNGRGQ